jgi:folylpolyglutamate synthase/dihydropteroate synthase
MSSRKLPPDAFEAYFALGPGRSYEAIAQKYGVTKRAVTALAKRDNWQERLAAIEKQARERGDQKIVETVEAMKERQLKVYQAVQRKGIDALRTIPITNASQLIKALAMALEGERVLRGEASDRLDIATLIKKEYEALTLNQGEEEKWDDVDHQPSAG